VYIILPTVSTHTHTRTVGKRIKHILQYFMFMYCACVQNNAPYGRNETESRTGLFTSMECSSARSLAVARHRLAFREYYAPRRRVRRRGFKSAATVCTNCNVDRAIFVFVLGDRRFVPLVERVVCFVGLERIIPRYNVVRVVTIAVFV